MSSVFPARLDLSFPYKILRKHFKLYTVNTERTGNKESFSLWSKVISCCHCSLCSLSLSYIPCPPLSISQRTTTAFTNAFPLLEIRLSDSRLEDTPYVFINRHVYEQTRSWRVEKHEVAKVWGFSCSLTCKPKHSQTKGYMEARSVVFSASLLLTLLWPALLHLIKYKYWLFINILQSLLVIGEYFCNFFTHSVIQVSDVSSSALNSPLL